MADNSCGLPSEGTDYQSLPNAVVALLPTPVVNDMGANKTVDWWDEWAPRQKAADGRSAPHGRSLSIEAQRMMLPTPDASAHKCRKGGDSQQSKSLAGMAARDATVRQPNRWGDYADAITLWERIIRPAPEPTGMNAKGTHKLSARFTEWMMGWPDGWVTDVPGITWNEALKACGNGVVTPQAVAALRDLLGRWAA